MIDYLYQLRTRVPKETLRLIGQSTVFNYFLKTMEALTLPLAKIKNVLEINNMQRGRIKCHILHG